MVVTIGRFMSKYTALSFHFTGLLQYACFFYHRQYRFSAYRQLVGVGVGSVRIRVVLPSCAVKMIRDTFPSVTYAGFKYPET